VAADRYLLDSNILIRWVQHEDPGAAVVEAALDELMIRNAELFYTSQNLGESGQPESVWLNSGGS
jgi:predicted nucleic acid-binding protein